MASYLSHQLGHAKCEVERLPCVEARVAEALVAGRQLFLEHGGRAAQALGHVLAGELEVDAAGPDVLFATDGEERDDLVHDRVEAAGLDPGRRAEDVRVHRVARPDDGLLRVAHGVQERRQSLRKRLGAHPDDERQPAGDAKRIQLLGELEQLLGGRRRPDLDPERVVHAREELGVSAVRLPGALADPEHVRRAVVPVPGERVAARQALLVVEHEALVARPDVDLVQLRRVHEIDAAGTHEADRSLDLRGDDLVALSFRRARDELLVPHLHLRQVGEAALREGAKQIERGRGLVVGLDHPLPDRRFAPPSDGWSSLTMCPKKDGSSSSPTRSTGSDLGLANCPAIRPTFTSGSAEP